MIKLNNMENNLRLVIAVLAIIAVAIASYAVIQYSGQKPASSASAYPTTTAPSASSVSPSNISSNISATTILPIPSAPSFNLSDFVLPKFYITHSEAVLLFGANGTYDRHVIFSSLKASPNVSTTETNSSALPLNGTIPPNATIINATQQPSNANQLRSIPDINTNTTFMANAINWGYFVSYSNDNVAMQEYVIDNNTPLPYTGYLNLLKGIAENKTYGLSFEEVNASMGNTVYSSIGIAKFPESKLLLLNYSNSTKAEFFIEHGYNTTAAITITIPGNFPYINVTELAHIVSNDMQG